jgi:hypothetical protein
MRDGVLPEGVMDMSAYASITPREPRLTRAVLWATLVAGTLDLLDATIFHGLRGIRLGSIYQAIAAGLLGPEAFQGGAPTIAMGIVLHYAIMAVMVTVYCLAAGRIALLVRYPLICGAVYGVLLYIVMNGIVLPLAAWSPAAAPTGIVLSNGLFAHIVLVGIPIALFARWCWRGRTP